MINIADNKKHFMEWYDKIVPEIDGTVGLKNYILDKTDFFTAPASRMYHLAEEGGLCEHTINVMYELMNFVDKYISDFEDHKVDWKNLRTRDEVVEKYLNVTKAEIIFAALTHDLCKCNLYKSYTKNVKNDKGQWEEQKSYTFDEQFVFGHGAKSVYIVMCFCNQISLDCATAIRYHMGGFENPGQVEPNVSTAYTKCPLTLLLHLADMYATFVLEK